MLKASSPLRPPGVGVPLIDPGVGVPLIVPGVGLPLNEELGTAVPLKG